MPTLNWCYGAKSPDLTQQIDNAIYAAHSYRNRLCELELQKRDRYYELLRRFVPEYVAAEDAVTAAESRLGELREVIQEARKTQRTKTPAGMEKTVAEVAEIKAALKELRATRKVAKLAAMDREDVREAIAENSATHKAECSAAKTESGLYWGTEATVKQACASFASGAPPRFARYSGEGQLSVQLQGGLQTDAATTVNTLCYFGEWIDGKRRECFIRIASDGRQPVFAMLPVVMHRPLPDGKIKWAHLERRKLANQFRWSLRLTIDVPSALMPHDEASWVAVHCGWHSVPSGLQVAIWRGSDGETGRVVLPNSHLEDYAKLQHLQQYRKLLLNDALAVLSEFRRSSKDKLPEWFVEKTEHCHQWRSPNRLGGLLHQWQSERFLFDESQVSLPSTPVELSRRLQPKRADVEGVRAALQNAGFELKGDGAYFEATRGVTYKIRVSNHTAYLPDQTPFFTLSNVEHVGAFLRALADIPTIGVFDLLRDMLAVDRRLWQHEARLSVRVSRRRSDLYRNFAASMQKRYGVLLFAKPEVSKLAVNTNPEDLEPDETASHRASRQAAVATLLQSLREKFPMRAIEVDQKNLTRECAKCGEVGSPDGRISSCDCKRDVDINALDNTIARGLAAQKDGALLALVEAAEKAEESRLAKLQKMQEGNRNRRLNITARKGGV